MQPPAVVEVGGRVYNPLSIEIGQEGLTLHRALLAAGGARDLVIAQANATVDHQNDADLQALVEASRTQGILECQKEIIQFDESKGTSFAKNLKFTSQKFTDVQSEIKKWEATSETRQTALFRSLPIQDVKDLTEQNRQVGYNQEKLRIFDEAPPIFGPREPIQGALDIATKKDRELSLKLNKPVARTLQPAVRGEMFVALDRPSSNPPVRYFFPHDLVVSGIAGEINLRAGDAVEVVDIQNTELAAQLGQYSAAPRDIAIQGAVKMPGFTSDLSTIGAVHGLNGPAIDDSRGVWTLVRSSESGKRQKVYVLPDRMVTVNGAAANAPTLEGDVYTYMILPQVPIVLESLVVQALSGVRARHGHHAQFVEQHRQKKAQREMVRQSVPGAAVVQRNLLPIR